MDNHNQLEEKLEIILITYNRCDYLAKTLQVFQGSPFQSCRFTVLDNCSPDATQEVVARFEGMFPNLRYVRNRVNISGNPNYLKAIELSSSEYTWILCDDDKLDFSVCHDVVNAILSGFYDLVEVGATEGGSWPRGLAIRVQDMVTQGFDYHFRMSFFPAYIFRTAKFDSACFAWGYKHIDLLYPQFEFLNKSIYENFNLYIAKRKIVIRNELNDHSFAPLSWYAGWVSCCRTILDYDVRKRAIEDATFDRGFYKCLGFWTILDKHLNDGSFWWRVFTILRAMTFCQKIKYLSIFPVIILPIPFSFWVWVRKMIYRVMDVPQSEVPPLKILDRG